MGQELLTADHSASVEINKHLRLANKLWEILQNKTFTRDKILAAAKEIHVFNRDAFEAKGRIVVKNYVYIVKIIVMIAEITLKLFHLSTAYTKLELYTYVHMYNH